MVGDGEIILYSIVASGDRTGDIVRARRSAFSVFKGWFCSQSWSQVGGIQGKSLRCVCPCLHGRIDDGGWGVRLVGRGDGRVARRPLGTGVGRIIWSV